MISLADGNARIEQFEHGILNYRVYTRHTRVCIREIYRFTKLKQKLGANRVPFLLPSQAWYKILSLSRARETGQERRAESARERRYRAGARRRRKERGRVGGREGQRSGELCLSRERKTGKRSPAKGPRYAVFLPLLRVFFSFSLSLPHLSFIRLSFLPLPAFRPAYSTPPPPLCAPGS